MSRHIPDWVLERFAVGQLPEGFTPEDIAQDPSVPERLAALQKSNAEVLRTYLPAQVAREVERRHGKSRPRAAAVRPWLPVLVPALVAAALVVALRPAVLRPAEDEGLRPKGLAPHLAVYRQARSAAETLEPGAKVRAGDVLQLEVVAPGARFAVVVSIDGAGAVTLHAPEHEGAAIELPEAGVQPLPHAYALDNAPRFERFILVTAERPFDTGRVLAAARALGADATAPLGLPGGFQQSSFVVTKEAP